MESSKSPEKMGLEWSLKPITILMVICGIPASYSTHRLFKFLFHIVVILSLTINILSNINSIMNILSFWIENVMYPRFEGVKSWDNTQNAYMVPRRLMDIFSKLLDKIFTIMVPFLFAVNYYFTGKWDNIWTCIQKIEREIVLSDNFKRQCKRQCIFITVILFLFTFILV